MGIRCRWILFKRRRTDVDYDSYRTDLRESPDNEGRVSWTYIQTRLRTSRTRLSSGLLGTSGPRRASVTVYPKPPMCRSRKWVVTTQFERRQRVSVGYPDSVPRVSTLTSNHVRRSRKRRDGVKERGPRRTLVKDSFDTGV